MIFGQNIDTSLNEIAKTIADLAFNNELDLDKVFIKLREKTYEKYQELEEKKKTRDKKAKAPDDNEVLTYDFMYIVRPDIEWDYKIVADNIINYLSQYNTNNSDDEKDNDNKIKVENIEHWGKKNLSYMIDGYTEGYYTLIKDMTCSRNMLKELINNKFKYNKDILRYMVVSKREEGE